MPAPSSRFLKTMWWDEMGLMSIFRGSMQADAPQAPDRDASDDRWFQSISLPTRSGQTVSTITARRVPVVRDCLAVLSQSVAALTFGVFERNDDDTRKRLRDHPVARLMRDPNPRDSSFEFLATMIDDLAAEGEFLAERVAPYTSREQLWRIRPGDYVIEKMSDRSRRFRIREPGMPERVLLEDEVWYIPLPPVLDGLRGRSPILTDGREQIGAAMALQAYANSFFGNDATPSLIFTHKGNFADQASKASFLSAWTKWFSGRNRHRPAVLEYGMDVKQLAITPEQAQFLETRQELNVDIARLWRMPPHKVGILDKATFSNIEHQGLEFVTDTLAPWLTLIERSIAKHFLAGEDGVYFEFNVASLLRGDIKSRYESYAVARQWGWLSVNEIRRLENQNGIGPAGDRYIEPLNMTPVGVPPDQSRGAEKAIAFLRESVAANGGRPRLKVIRNAA